MQKIEITHNYASNVDVSDMCANLHYFLILPFSPLEAVKEENFGTKPFIFTYKSEEMKIRQLVGQYREQSQLFAKQQIDIVYEDGNIIQPSMMIKEMQKELARSNLDGILLFVKTYNQTNQPILKPEEYEDSGFVDECCVVTYLESNPNFGKIKNQTIVFEIPLKHKVEYISLKADLQDQFGAFLIQKLLKKIHEDYGHELTRDSIDSITIKDYKLPLSEQEKLIRQKIFDKSVLVIQFKNSSLAFKRISFKNYNSFLIIYKENQKQPYRFKYEDICQYSFELLYKEKLMLKESKDKKQAIYCLKIMDLIIRPQEMISQAEVYFKNNEENKPLNVVGHVVNEKMLFYKIIPTITNETNPFTIDELIIPEEFVKTRDACRVAMKDRAKNAKNQHFKKIENLQPILIYTSDLRYKDQITKKNEVIYQSLNKFLRDSKVLSLKEEDYSSDWRFKYSSTLLRQLQKISKQTKQVYRGINYNPRAEVGDILTFKQFVSTSTNIIPAIQFATTGVSPFTLLNIKTKSGRSIKQYSIYVNEEEYLLEPFTEFIVKKVADEKHSNRNFKVYYLQEIETQKAMPEVYANFVLWIDDKPKEGRKIFDMIEITNQTTILIQLLSTQDLANWLQKYKSLLEDPTAKIIFITNMTRKEGKNQEIVNGMAGIESAVMLRKATAGKTVPVFFYIGDVKLAKDKINSCKQLSTDNLRVSNQPQDIYNFLKEHLLKNTYKQ